MPCVNTRMTCLSLDLGMQLRLRPSPVLAHPLLHSRYRVPKESFKRPCAHPFVKSLCAISASRSCPHWPLERSSSATFCFLSVPVALTLGRYRLDDYRRKSPMPRASYKQGPDDFKRGLGPPSAYRTSTTLPWTMDNRATFSRILLPLAHDLSTAVKRLHMPTSKRALWPIGVQALPLWHLERSPATFILFSMPCSHPD